MRSVTRTSAFERDGPKVSTEALLHVAIRSLRLYFASLKPGDSIESEILVDMMDLYRAEYYARRTDAAKHHIFVFNSLVDISGTSPPQRPRCRDVWNLSDVIVAIYGCSRTVDASIPSHPVQQYRVESEYHGHIGTGFESIPYLFNPEMRILIQDLVHWANRVEHLPSVDYDQSLNNASLVADAEDLLARLVWLPPPPPTVLIGEQRTNISLQSGKVPCVRDALVLWLLFSCSYPSLAKAIRLLLPRLEDTLQDVLDQESHENKLPSAEQKLIFWVAFIRYLLSDSNRALQHRFVSTLVYLEREWRAKNDQPLQEAARGFPGFARATGGQPFLTQQEIIFIIGLLRSTVLELMIITFSYSGGLASVDFPGVSPNAPIRTRSFSPKAASPSFCKA